MANKIPDHVKALADQVQAKKVIADLSPSNPGKAINEKEAANFDKQFGKDVGKNVEPSKE